MGRVSYLSKDQAAESVRPIYEGVEKKLGVMLNFFKVLAHNPTVLQGFLGLDSSLGRMKLDGKLRELAYLKASQINDCGYCLHYHRALGQKAGLSERQVHEVSDFESSDAYDDLQREVLRFAEGVTRNVRADDAVVDRLRRHLSEQELMELTMTVGLANLTNRVNEALQIELP
jgi:uncharacterized peroxidase-related enzyme